MILPSTHLATSQRILSIPHLIGAKAITILAFEVWRVIFRYIEEPLNEAQSMRWMEGEEGQMMIPAQAAKAGGPQAIYVIVHILLYSVHTTSVHHY
jgi:hypothetical protein